MKTKTLPTILLSALATLGLVFLVGAGRPLNLTEIQPANYARAGFSGGLRYAAIAGTTVRLGCLGDGAAATMRAAASALTVCYSSDPNATIGAQGAAGTADDIVVNGTSYSNCTGVPLLANEAIDLVPDFDLMERRSVGWTDTFCTIPIRTDHGVNLYPSCRVDADCTGTLGLSGATCTRTDEANGCVHVLAIEQSGGFESSAAWR